MIGVIVIFFKKIKVVYVLYMQYLLPESPPTKTCIDTPPCHESLTPNTNTLYYEKTYRSSQTSRRQLNPN